MVLMNTLSPGRQIKWHKNLCTREFLDKVNFFFHTETLSLGIQLISSCYWTQKYLSFGDWNGECLEPCFTSWLAEGPTFSKHWPAALQFRRSNRDCTERGTSVLLSGNKSESFGTSSRVTKPPFFLNIYSLSWLWGQSSETDTSFLWEGLCVQLEDENPGIYSAVHFTQLLNFSFQAIKKKDCNWNVV